MIKIKNLTKRYGETSILENFSCDIQANKLTVILGANGAGKSTLMNCIGRLIDFQSGDIEIGGQSIHDYSQNAFALICSFMKQSHHIEMRLTVRELIEFGRYPHSKGHLTTDDREVINRVLSQCHLTKMQETSIHALSGGQLQRVLLAMVLAQDTPLILLDEPLSNLDLKQSVKMIKLLKQSVACGKSVVMILHDINLAAMAADEIILMKKGKCLVQGNVEETIQPHWLKACYNVDFNVEKLGQQTISYISMEEI